MCANESPFRIANVHIIASRYRKFAPKNSSFGFMATYGLDGPLEPDESIEHACAYRFISVQDVRVRFLKLRPTASSQYWQKIQFEVSPGGGTLSSKSEGLQRGAKERESVRFDFLTA
jgi:hypothetical protein